MRQKGKKQSQNHLPVELTTMTASNPSSFPPVTLSETQVLISSPSPPVSVVTIRSEILNYQPLKLDNGERKMEVKQV